MMKRSLVWIAFCVATFALAANAQQTSPPPATQQEAFLKKNCITCHNEKLHVASLMLDKANVDHPADNAATWEKVVQKLRLREMPPSGMPRPDAAAYDSMVTYLETALDRAAEAHPDPGRPVIHRLNRAEYTNAIRDILALDVDGTALLPPDDSGYGFDNIGDVLSVSPLLLERYLSAASRISRLAVGDPSIGTTSVEYDVPHNMVQEDRESEDLPFGSRGGIAVHHDFPLDAEYAIHVRLQRGKFDGEILGLDRPHQLDIRLDGTRLKLFTVGGNAKQSQGENKSAKIGAADDSLMVRFPAKAGPHLIAVSFLKDTVKEEGELEPTRVAAFFEGVGTVSVDGPYNATGSGDTPSRRRIFVCHPATHEQEGPCATRILTALAQRAYRRPISSQEIPSLLAPYQEGRKEGGFETGIRLAVERILVSPNFLFRIEVDPKNVAPGTAYRVSDVELASRLSFFLWSSVPDDELLGLAERGKLKDPDVLAAQVKRMLADPRSDALVTNFVGQWLYLRNMDEVLPDPVAFPDFDENLRQSMITETQLFFQSMIHEDRSVVDLLRADYTFLNERLARHYGIPGIYGNEFRRVKLQDDERIGLLGQGSILTVTSYPNRTSPTIRGKWVLENILGDPTPPPPPNVPSLKEDKSSSALTMRQRMEEHRANPVCASCHSRMDPLGFALENLDGVGGWRTTMGNNPIDASGKLPDGTEFMGPAGLRQIVLGKQDQFVDTLTEKLMTYALGRGVEASDMPAVRKVVHESATSDYRWSSLITGIVDSMPFEMRRAR
jgi:mono/diheme cytochrome c family protein